VLNESAVTQHPGNGKSRAKPQDRQQTRRGPNALRVVDIHEFLACELPPREEVLSPWLLTQSLNMVYAWRGVGKTHVALGIAYAVASGCGFLGWKASKPRGVLYLDGEMPGPALQKRLATIVAAADKVPAPGMLKIFTPDLQELGVPDLAEAEGQKLFNQQIDDGVELIIIDNLSSLVRTGGNENEAESWTRIQAWALKMRQRGKSVLFIHHAGKGGSQRGTSKREDLLDTVICLKHPSDYLHDQGARFEIHFEKSRNQCGESLAPIEAALVSAPDNTQTWATRTVEASTFDRVIELAKEGLSQVEIAVELRVNRSTVSRAWRKGEATGQISKGKKAGGR